MGRLSLIYESILLSEGRLEKARERYPMINDIVFNHYVNADPSGNQKYLDWLLGTTLSDSKNYSSGNENPALRPDKRPIQYHTDMVSAIEFFHQNQQRFQEKDINRYRSLTDLEKSIEVVMEKIQTKEFEKQAKKDRDIVYNDDRWLVIHPKSHTASCKYGAGTKWCVTMKDNTDYWKQYSRNALFYFIIDKTKDKDDPKYKVAYRLRGSSGKSYELWDATDSEFSKRDSGFKYMEELPGKLKEAINIHHAENSKDLSDSSSDDPRAQAILDSTGQEIADGLDEHYYGMEIFETDEGEYWVAGTEEEMEDAVRFRYEDMSDDDLVKYYDPDGQYLYMYDPDGFAEEEARSYVYESGISDEEILELASLEDDYWALKNELEELQDDEEEFSEEREEELLNQMESVLEDAKEIVYDRKRDDVERCLDNGVADCLIDEYGWFRNVTEMFRSGMVYLERDDLIDNMVGWDSNYEDIAGYGWDYGTDEDGNEWIVFQIDY